MPPQQSNTETPGRDQTAVRVTIPPTTVSPTAQLVGGSSIVGGVQPRAKHGIAAVPSAAAARLARPPQSQSLLNESVKKAARSTKSTQKLTLFPEDIQSTQPLQFSDDDKVPQQDDLYHQLAQTPPERLSKLDRKKLPRVTAFCTSETYQLKELDTFFTTLCRNRGYGPPKKVDECLFISLPSTAMNSDLVNGSLVHPLSSKMTKRIKSTVGKKQDGDGLWDYSSESGSDDEVDNTSRLINQPRYTDKATLQDSKSSDGKSKKPIATAYMPVGDMFLFDYGVVVLWGFRIEDEQKILQLLSPFETHPYLPSLIETEEFVFHYNDTYQPRIYDDIITLRSPRNQMTKLTISHGIAQSTKLALYENLVDNTIINTAQIPKQMAATGAVSMRRSAITKKIGQLFTMRIEVNLVSNVLDAPEIFWAEPRLGPLYEAIRGYLEISKRVDVLNQRVAVISDLLDMLKEHLNSSHGETLEWIVIILIGFEICIGIITIIIEYVSRFH